MPPSRREQQRLETRQRVFDAAVEVFRRDGVSAAKIEDITRLAEVSRGTFYFHFPTKEHVLTELLLVEEAELVDRVEGVAHDAPIEAVLAAAAQAIADRWSEEPELFVEVGVIGLRNTAATLATGPGGIRASLAGRFVLAADRDELTQAVPPQILADFYLANAFAVAVGWSTNPILPLDQALQASALLFLNGARAAHPI
jgi:AcrR family transcriptional regulator